MRLKFIPVIFLCFFALGFHAQTPATIQPYVSMKANFQPRDLVVSGNHLVIAGQNLMTDYEDSVAGKFGQRGFYPAMVFMDTNLRFQSQLTLKNEGSRNEFKQIQLLTDTTLLVLLEGRQSAGAKRISRLLIMDFQGKVLREEILQSRGNECFVKRLKPDVILVGYTNRETSRASNGEDSTRLCLQVLSDALQLTKEVCDIAVVSGNGNLVKDAALLQNGFLVATNLGLKHLSNASVFLADPGLSIRKSAFLFAHNSETNRIATDEQGNIFLGVDTHKGSSLVRIDQDLDTVFNVAFGECIHDDIKTIIEQGNKLIIAHDDGGSIRDYSGHFPDRSAITIFSLDGKILGHVVFGSTDQQEKLVGMAQAGKNFFLLSRKEDLIESEAKGKYSSFHYYSFILRKVAPNLKVLKQAEFGNF